MKRPVKQNNKQIISPKLPSLPADQRTEWFKHIWTDGLRHKLQWQRIMKAQNNFVSFAVLSKFVRRAIMNFEDDHLSLLSLISLLFLFLAEIAR